MQVVVLDSAAAVAEFAAGQIVGLIRQKPAAVLGLATGRTPVALYERLVSEYKAGSVSFREVSSFNLDEYVGIDANDPRSFRAFMHSGLFNRVDILAENAHLPSCPDGSNPWQVSATYERAIEQAGGIDLQLLGIGANGHIGFNEPTSSLASRTRVKTLTQVTVQSNTTSDEHGGSCPELAITMGIGTILDARRLLLLACGTGKAQAVSAAVEGPVSSMCPASALQLHPSATVVVDRAAASELNLIDYYLDVHAKQAQLASLYSPPPW